VVVVVMVVVAGEVVVGGRGVGEWESY